MTDAPVLDRVEPAGTNPTGEVPAPPISRTPEDDSRRRFVRALLAGAAAVTLPYLWVLWDLWNGSVSPLRSLQPNNFYELQARAMFDGRLNVPSGSLGIEGFLHDGRTYTYFGVWPSIIRMPILLVTHSMDARLTAPSLLIAWVLTGLFAGLLLWRLRFMLRGSTPVGRAEAASYGAFMACLLGGSVMIYIAANPSVYDEDFAWSMALVMASLFYLLGVLERPTTRGVWLAGLFILAANLNRSPTGYACVITAFLVAAWLFLGRSGQDQRRFAFPVALAGLVPLLASCAVTYGKFGLPFGLPMADQVWAHINAHRRAFLAANGGKAFSLGFIPSTAWAYLDPTGLVFTSVFPFIAEPTTPAHAITHVVLDQTYPTPSATAASPFLVLLSLWGTVTLWRRRAASGLQHLGEARLIWLGAGIATGGVLVWGYIAYRYVCDLMPFFMVASSVGLIDLGRRMERWSPTGKRWMLGALLTLASFSVAANLAITAAPSTWFSQAQVSSFVSRQFSTTPSALASTVTLGHHLPAYAPAGSLYIAGSCDGLYRSTGDSFANSPGQQIMNATWAPVEQAPFMNHVIKMTFNTDHWNGPAIPVMTYGRATLYLEPAPNDHAVLWLKNGGAPSIHWPKSIGFPFPQILHGQFQVTVVTDPYLHSIRVDWYGVTMMNRYLEGPGPGVVQLTPTPAVGTAPPEIEVSQEPAPVQHFHTCKALLDSLGR